MNETFDFQKFIRTLTTRPGIYQMINRQGEVLYVGKARNLKKRVASYFQRHFNQTKTTALVKQINRIEVIITASENEALLLEHNMIKKLQPRYNVLFRDDKTYPYIFLSSHQEFPRLDFYRGPKGKEGHYYGPYPSIGAVRETLTLLQSLFRIRQCSDHFFKNRSRPCLQYFIKRCSAPCVGLIDAKSYQKDIDHVQLFLEGKNKEVRAALINRMEEASAELDYERAAKYRDQIKSLGQIQQRQEMVSAAGDLDVIAMASHDEKICVEVLFIRAGRLLGNKTFLSRTSLQANDEEIVASFITQNYLDKSLKNNIPSEIIVSPTLPDRLWFEKGLSEICQHKVKINDKSRGIRSRWLKIATQSAKQALASDISSRMNQYHSFEMLQNALKLDTLPKRMECFDISHTSGEATVASCVVFDHGGAVKSDYRRFNINDVTKGDDYAALRQAIYRRYKKLKENEAKLPDILFIDGGKGQLRQAESVFEELQISGVRLIAIAKGKARKPGLEVLHLSGEGTPLVLPSDSVALHLIQKIRDEAHRFAIIGHRHRRDKARQHSILETIPGIGVKKRRELLRHLGGLREVQKASVDELSKVPGISQSLAELIYQQLHGT